MRCPDPNHSDVEQEPGAKFCHKCGKPLIEDPVHPEPPKPDIPTGHQEHINKSQSGEEPPKAQALLRFERHGKFGYVDTKGNEVIPPNFDHARDFHEGLAAVEQNKRWGYINPKGNFVVSPQYLAANDFSESRAAVYNGFWGYVDLNGSVVIPCQYNGALEFSEGLATICKNGLWGYIDANGNRVIQPKFHDAHSFKNGLARVKNKPDDNYGYIGKKGDWVIKPRFSFARDFSEGNALVLVEGNNNYYCFIDERGHEKFFCTWNVADNFHEGLAYVLEGKEYGYIDTNGNSVIKPSYDDAARFSEGLAAVKFGNQWGYIDKKGKIIISPQYLEAGPFQNGMAIANTNNGFVMIDKKGKTLFSTTCASSLADNKEFLNKKSVQNCHKILEIRESRKKIRIHYLRLAILTILSIILDFFIYDQNDNWGWAFVPSIIYIIWCITRFVTMADRTMTTSTDSIIEYALTFIPLAVLNIGALFFTNGWCMLVLIPLFFIIIAILAILYEE